MTGDQHGPCYGHERSSDNGPTDPPDRREERALSWAEADRVRERVAAGRCTLRADRCGWPECTKHGTNR